MMIRSLTQRLYTTTCRTAAAQARGPLSTQYVTPRLAPIFVPTISRSLTTAGTAAAVSRVDKNENAILVNWNGKPDSWSKFHYDWLRDNCPCTECKHEKYNQRLLNTLEDAMPANVDVEGSAEAVGVKWRDGHHSQYPYDWLLTNSYCHNNITKDGGKEKRKRKVTLWDNKSTVITNPPKMNYNDIMSGGDEKMLTLLRNLYEYGFCFILNTPPTKEGIMEAARKVGPVQNSCYGEQWYMEVGLRVNVRHMSYTSTRIIPHTDSPAFSESPGTVFMQVLESQDVEGATSSMIDGFKIANHIRKQEPEYFSLLSKVSLPYHLYFSNGEEEKDAVYRNRRHTFALDNDNELSHVHLNNIDRRPIDEVSLSEAREVLSCDADEAITKMYQALRYLHNLLIHDDRFAYKFDMEPGLMLALNNHRIFHGRDKFTEGFRIVSGVHHIESVWLSKLEVLEQRCS